jgi:hypothetical protein
MKASRIFLSFAEETEGGVAGRNLRSCNEPDFIRLEEFLSDEEGRLRPTCDDQNGARLIQFGLSDVGNSD